MDDLNLNFLEDSYTKDNVTIIDLLEKYGQNIEDSSQGHFEHTVTIASKDGNLHLVSLYILATEIPYEYRLINLEIIDIANVKFTLFSLSPSEPKTIDINISQGLGGLESVIFNNLKSVTVGESLRLLVHQVQLKRKMSGDISNNDIIQR